MNNDTTTIFIIIAVAAVVLLWCCCVYRNKPSERLVIQSTVAANGNAAANASTNATANATANAAANATANAAPWITNKTPIPLNTNIDNDEVARSVDPGAHLKCREECANADMEGIDIVTCMNICLQKTWLQPAHEHKNRFLRNIIGLGM